MTEIRGSLRLWNGVAHVRPARTWRSLASAVAVAGSLTLDPASTVAFTVGDPLTEAAYVFASYASLATAPRLRADVAAE